MSFSIYPLGDSAVTIELGSVISESLNRKVLAMQQWLNQNPDPCIKETRIAFSSLTAYYDLVGIKEKAGKNISAFEYISNLLGSAFTHCSIPEERHHVTRIPVCYHPAVAPDMDFICKEKSISRETLVALHTAAVYRIYMIGFLPGFPYMGEVDEKIAIGRKATPRPIVPKGSVGIAGRQTGIYPLESPGGWQLIGRTPYKIFDPLSEEVVFLQPGDKVQFSEISLEEFHHLND